MTLGRIMLFTLLARPPTGGPVACPYAKALPRCSSLFLGLGTRAASDCRRNCYEFRRGTHPEPDPKVYELRRCGLSASRALSTARPRVGALGCQACQEPTSARPRAAERAGGDP